MIESLLPRRVLVLGATGMLGNAALRFFAESPGFEVSGSVRSLTSAQTLREDLQEKLHVCVDVENADSLLRLFDTVRPAVVINCVGLVKQLSDSDDPLAALPINAMLPHRLSRICSLVGARLIHISTDCVFSGITGNYCESAAPDAQDVYGRSKLLGEVVNSAHAITLRTSIIGHELTNAHGLVGWFLREKIKVNGYKRAVFSGFPTVEIVRIIRDYVIPNPHLHGLYHVSAKPIDKFSLLQLVANQYGHDIDIVPDERIVINRSLNSTRFSEATGYISPEWSDLVHRMHAFS